MSGPFCYAIANADGTYHDGSLTDNVCTAQDAECLTEVVEDVNEGPGKDPRLPLKVVALSVDACFVVVQSVMFLFGNHTNVSFTGTSAIDHAITWLETHQESVPYIECIFYHSTRQDGSTSYHARLNDTPESFTRGAYTWLRSRAFQNPANDV